MSNLIIGDTSQLSYYFPEDYIRISSRNIDFNRLNNSWESVYICFAEQNMKDKSVDFITPNFILTRDIINELRNNSKRIIIYTTCELWNLSTGAIDAETPFNYIYSNDYCRSKEMLFNWVKEERVLNKLNNVIVIHPFNFNSVYRTNDYLFGKVFNSIINKKKISLGNTYFLRDIMHAKYIVQRSIKAEKDEIVGSGRLTHINMFIRDLYEYFQMDYDEWVIEDLSYSVEDKNFHAKNDRTYSYVELLKDTIEDIENKIK